MPELRATPYAMDRFREHVADVPNSVIQARLRAKIFEIAAEFGAPFVKLSGGQRIILRGGLAVNVLPSNFPSGGLDPLNDPGGMRG